MHALQFLDLGDCDRAGSVSLEHCAGCLHILSYEGHHLFTLAGIGHVCGDWEIDQPGLGEDDDRRAVLDAIEGALQAKGGGGTSGILDGTGEVSNDALDRHRLGVGYHLSTLTRERWIDEHRRKSGSKEYKKQSGALHVRVQDLQVQILLRVLGGANAGFRGHISGLAAETGRSLHRAESICKRLEAPVLAEGRGDIAIDLLTGFASYSERGSDWIDCDCYL